MESNVRFQLEKIAKETAKKTLINGDHLKGEIEIYAPHKIFQNQYIEVYNDDVIFPSGLSGTYLRVVSPTPLSVSVLPIRKDGRFGLIKNFRHGARGWCLEAVKGGVEQGETIEEAAARELEEEAGLHSELLDYIGSFSDSPAVLSGRMHCFFANTLSVCEQKKEWTEAISDILFFNHEEYIAACKEMDFVDGITELMIYKYIFIKLARENPV